MSPEDIGEFDEVYITAGLKGRAGGLELKRKPRKRGLKQRGRDTWDSDRLPIFGLLCRGSAEVQFIAEHAGTPRLREIFLSRPDVQLVVGAT